MSGGWGTAQALRSLKFETQKFPGSLQFNIWFLVQAEEYSLFSPRDQKMNLTQNMKKYALNILLFRHYVV